MNWRRKKPSWKVAAVVPAAFAVGTLFAWNPSWGYKPPAAVKAALHDGGGYDSWGSGRSEKTGLRWRASRKFEDIDDHTSIVYLRYADEQRTHSHAVFSAVASWDPRKHGGQWRRRSGKLGRALAAD